MEIKKELLDQSIHFGAGLVGTFLLGFLFWLWVAAPIMAAVAYGREIYQRVSNGDPWYECGKGCMLDLGFWALGITTAVIIRIFI